MVYSLDHTQFCLAEELLLGRADMNEQEVYNQFRAVIQGGIQTGHVGIPEVLNLKSNR